MRLLEHTASNQFRAKGAGDIVYVVNVTNGQLRLVGRMVVDRVVSKAEADRHFKSDCWPATDHCIARSGTAGNVRFNRFTPPSVVAGLKFRTPKGDVVGPVFSDSQDHLLDSQTLRGVRELTADSAAALDQVLVK
jgi:hypothetical protein